MRQSDFLITHPAKARIQELLLKEPEGVYFRISVDGGGCSGFQYDFSFTKQEPGDLVIDDVLLIDELSLSFLTNSTIDFEDTLAGSKFVIKNPNASAKCGCGNSFAV